MESPKCVLARSVIIKSTPFLCWDLESTIKRQISVPNKRDYIAQVQTAVQHLHNCGAQWLRTVPVHEVFQGKTAWQGDKGFELTATPKANYARLRTHGPDIKHAMLAVLEIPPVKDARQTACPGVNCSRFPCWLNPNPVFTAKSRKICISN